MKYNEQVKEVEYCNTSHWSTLLSYLVPGSSSLLPESTCKQIALRHNSFFHNGQYWIRPSFNDPPFQVGIVQVHAHIEFLFTVLTKTGIL